MKIALDGQKSGAYRGDCECGTSWTGQTEVDQRGLSIPALPVAEAVVHHNMCHDEQAMQLVFTWCFEEVLAAYWTRVSNSSDLAKVTIPR